MYSLGADANGAAAQQAIGPELERGLRTTSLIVRPITGFLWGALVGAVIAPSGQRGDAAVEGGVYCALVGFGKAAVCLPGQNAACSAASVLPIGTAIAGYKAWQRR